MMSNTKTQPKTSNLESKASFEIVRIVGLLALICLAGAIGATVWNSVHNINNIWYMRWSIKPEAYFFIQYFYYFLLHATFIPVALYVSMAMVRSLQSYFMNNDLEMYYAPTDTPALVRTMTLNEELGQISHVFSDKTGTLTCNLMDYRKVCFCDHSNSVCVAVDVLIVLTVTASIDHSPHTHPDVHQRGGLRPGHHRNRQGRLEAEGHRNTIRVDHRRAEVA
jgi:P-type E1-E2 ATPase